MFLANYDDDIDRSRIEYELDFSQWRMLEIQLLNLTCLSHTFISASNIFVEDVGVRLLYTEIFHREVKI